MGLHFVTQQRPITDALRRSVVEDLPELEQIQNLLLRNKAIEAWAFALSHSSFGRISDIPPGGNPGMNVLKRGTRPTTCAGWRGWRCRSPTRSSRSGRRCGSTATWCWPARCATTWASRTSSIR